MHRFVFAALFSAVAGVAAAADPPAAAALPLTIDERNAACIAAEDGDAPRAIALADSVLGEGAAITIVQRAEATACRGWAQTALERHDDARRDAHALEELLPQLPANADRVRLTRRAGGILHRSRDRIGAVDLYARAVADAEAQGLELERVPLLVNLGVLHSEFEEHERARVNYEQALALMQRLGDFRYEAPVRFNLGLNLAGQERYADAIPHYRRALQLVRETGAGSPAQEVGVMMALAVALSETGAVDEAARLTDEVKQRGQSLIDAGVQHQLTMIDARQREEAGDYVGALALLDAPGLENLQEIQQWTVLRRRAIVLEKLGRFEEASATLKRINTLREQYLRHQNHERLAALDTHMRDREQRVELERLQVAAQEQARQLSASTRLQWGGIILASFLLVLGTGVFAWQRRMNTRLFEASRTDPLTGLANRREMTQRLRALGSAPNDAAVMLIDIDDFKRINDEHGHDIGDEVLTAFARRLRAQAGDDVAVARWGGEEFLAVVSSTSAAGVTALAERLRQHFAQAIDTRRGPIAARVSIGIANLPLPGARGADSWHCSVQLADGALYLAKRAGRDAWACYWIDREIPDWPPERLGREPHLARSVGAITPLTSRPLRDPIAAIAG